MPLPISPNQRISALLTIIQALGQDNLKFCQSVKALEKLSYDTQRLYIKCPWIHQHTTPNHDTDASILFTGTYSSNPEYHCFHQHCDGRQYSDVVDYVIENNHEHLPEFFSHLFHPQDIEDPVERSRLETAIFILGGGDPTPSSVPETIMDLGMSTIPITTPPAIVSDSTASLAIPEDIAAYVDSFLDTSNSESENNKHEKRLQKFQHYSEISCYLDFCKYVSEQEKGHSLYNIDDSSWYVWNDIVWAKSKGNEIYARLSRYVEDYHKNVANMLDWFGNLPKEDKSLFRAQYEAATGKCIHTDQLKTFLHSITGAWGISSVESILQKILTCTTEIFDQHPELFAFHNGVWDFTTKEFRSHDPKDFLTLAVDYDYDPAATCPNFDWTLEWALQDKADRDFFVKFSGLCLTGYNVKRYLNIYSIVPDTLKSTIIDSLFSALGPYAKSISHEVLTKGRFGMSSAGSFELARVGSARFLGASEIESGSWNLEILKALVSGDRMTVAGKGEHSRDWIPCCKIIVSGNKQPTIYASGSSDPIFSKLTIIAAEHQLPIEMRKDKSEITPIIKSERAGMFNRLLAGYYAYKETGLIPSKNMVDEITEYSEMSDPLENFFTECCVISPNAEFNSVLLYHRYQDWASANKQHQLSQVSFGRTMKERGFRKKQWTDNQRYYLGITLKVADFNPDVKPLDLDKHLDDDNLDGV